VSLAPPVFERETPAVVVEEFDLKALFSSSLTLLACFVLSCLYPKQHAGAYLCGETRGTSRERPLGRAALLLFFSLSFCDAAERFFLRFV